MIRLLASLLLYSGALCADDLGRLFTTPEERVQIDRIIRSQPDHPSPEGAAKGEIRTKGGTLIWRESAFVAGEEAKRTQQHTGAKK